MTAVTRALLHALLQRRGESMPALDIERAAGVPAGPLFNALERLQHLDWVTCDVQPRPRQATGVVVRERRYRLSERGHAEATVALRRYERQRQVR